MKRKRKKKHQFSNITTIAICILFVICMITMVQNEHFDSQNTQTTEPYEVITITDDEPYVVINNNNPLFSEDDKLRTDAFEIYSDLDELGRCGIAYANVCQALMPTEERGKIGHIKPTGWHTVKYNDIIDGNYLYNRCHLIGFQLTGENDNEKNLITGTRYLNVTGMLPFENQIADYVQNTNNHVLYRVTPYFHNNNLVASGVYLEAYSVEDNGTGICFYVYCPNIQPCITIDYTTGESKQTQ